MIESQGFDTCRSSLEKKVEIAFYLLLLFLGLDTLQQLSTIIIFKNWILLITHKAYKGRVLHVL